MRIIDNTILITGGTSGIGPVLAEAQTAGRGQVLLDTIVAATPRCLACYRISKTPVVSPASLYRAFAVFPPCMVRFITPGSSQSICSVQFDGMQRRCRSY